MKRCIPLLALFLLFAAETASARFVTYKEEFYRLFHTHHNRTPDNYIENIYWLEQALNAPFANPLHALTRIENEVQWEKYRYLFMMHVNIRLAEQHMFLGNMWNKRNAFFFNAPFREPILSSLEIAETSFRAALFYWGEALAWLERLDNPSFRWLNLQQVQFWEDEAHRIRNGQFNYARTINRELRLLQQVRERFQAMEAN
ncbi:MAG: hypothetical protein FWD91_01735 [Treponema sp.]|nr:hypothetical protein [Treponema sp.]